MQRFKNAKALATFVEVAAKIKESGSSVRGRSMIARRVHTTVRHALYMPAMVALKYNPLMKTFGERLEVNGRAPKAVIAACLHKLLRQISQVLKSRHVFDASFWKIGLTLKTVSDPNCFRHAENPIKKATFHLKKNEYNGTIKFQEE